MTTFHRSVRALALAHLVTACPASKKDKGQPADDTTTPTAEQIAIVSDGDSQWSNWDVFLLDLSTRQKTRLTTHAAIDNHPQLSPTNDWIVFSSNRGASGEFDIYLADRSDVEGTAHALTNDGYPNGNQTAYPDRHPHFHPSGTMIAFTSKNRPLTSEITIVSECSLPKIIVPPRYYEGVNVIVLDESGEVAQYVELDIRDAWDSVASPDIWVDSAGTYVGHPTFSHDGAQLLFTGSIDGEGRIWEVYVAGFDSDAVALTPGSLRRVTNGPAVGDNPIQMSGGAHFAEDDSVIFFSSTRTTRGNSQIFSVPADATDVPVTSATQVTSHNGNDYVPETTDDGAIVFTSDLGPSPICNSNGEAVRDEGGDDGPTQDLDIWIINSDGTGGTNLTDSTTPETLLIADEVSWFCGMPPNLKACTELPRIEKVENIWIGKTAWLFENNFADSTVVPSGLLQKFDYEDQAIDMYTLGWTNMERALEAQNPTVLDAVVEDMMQMIDSGFPGLEDESALNDWLDATESLRNTHYVVPSIMYDKGIGAPWSSCTQDFSVSIPPSAFASSCPEVRLEGAYELTPAVDTEMVALSLSISTTIAERPLGLFITFFESNTAQLSVGAMVSEDDQADCLAYEGTESIDCTGSYSLTPEGGILSIDLTTSAGALESVDRVDASLTAGQGNSTCFGAANIPRALSSCPW